MRRSTSSLSLYIGEDNITIQTGDIKPKSSIHRCGSCNNLVDDDVVYVLRSDGLQMRIKGNVNHNGLDKKLIQQEKKMYELGKQLERDRRSTATLNRKIDKLNFRSMSNLVPITTRKIIRKQLSYDHVQKKNWRKGILRYFGKS